MVDHAQHVIFEELYRPTPPNDTLPDPDTNSTTRRLWSTASRIRDALAAAARRDTMADRLYDDTDVEAVKLAIGDCRYDDMSDEQARAVLETLTAAGSPLLTRHRAQVAEQIAQAIEACTDQRIREGDDDAAGAYQAVRIAREVGGTTGEESERG